MNKNVGILTYDYSINFGAHLQAYALCEKLKQLGFKPHIIRWAQHYYQTAGYEDDNLKPFRDKYLPRTKLCYAENELLEVCKDLPRIIIGGDQVFRNWANLEEEPILRYFGDFIEGNKVLASYGASFGVEYFEGTEYTINHVKNLLKRFDEIGVREKSGVDLLKNTFNVEGKEVLDPVFLLDKNKYAHLAKKANKISDDYIAYMYLADKFGLGEVKDELTQNLSNEKIININKKSEGGYTTPEQWLSNLLNAKFVITDSFHCVAFSIIFNKPFIVVNRDFGGNSRIDNILDKLNLSQCKKNTLSEISKIDLKQEINWNEVNSIIDFERKQSETFLNNILALPLTQKEPYIIDEKLVNIRRKYEETYLLNLNKRFEDEKKKKKQQFENIFSIKNEYKNNVKRKIITILGTKIKIKTKRGYKMQEKAKYTTLHYLAAILKEYKIDNIVASPGTQNACFNILTNETGFFKLNSVLDERSAAYVASGICAQTQKPVVITCTEATASRNYLPALTEAYYRKLPIIAVTFTNQALNNYNLGAQHIDRSISQNDIKSLSIELPILNTEQDKENILVLLNVAITTAISRNMPVHINCPGSLDFEYFKENMELPTDIWATNVYNENNLQQAKKDLENKNIAIFIGSHNKFSQEEENIISDFACAMDVPVLCDCTSGYYGRNKVLISQVAFMLDVEKKPDIVIDLGEVTGEYSTPLFIRNSEMWRISKQDGLKCRYNLPISKLFNCSEKLFFNELKTSNNNKYYSYLKMLINEIKIPELPLSMPLVCYELSKNISENSTLHLAILNALRSMNYFKLTNGVETSCNVGGFGIDGALSTTVGRAIADPNKTHYCVIGDLAFFYDMNILGNRHIANNLKIILVNNNRGEEFRLNWLLEKSFGDKTVEIVAAAGHYKNGAELWAKSCNFEYINIATKDELESKIKEFCLTKYDKPALLEVFTSDKDEKQAQWLIQSANKKV